MHRTFVGAALPVLLATLVAPRPCAAQDQDATVDPTTEVAPQATPPVVDDRLALELRTRQEIATVHRAFGIATWISMATTAVLGWIQFADEYGFHGSANETACATGHAVMQDFCTGTPWPHAIAGLTTAALYFTTAGVSLAMPAPLPRTADVELHATLRWFHVAGVIAVAAFGIVTANVDADFQTRQALAVTHEVLAVSTLGVLTAAAAIVVF